MKLLKDRFAVSVSDCVVANHLRGTASSRRICRIHRFPRRSWSPVVEIGREETNGASGNASCAKGIGDCNTDCDLQLEWNTLVCQVVKQFYSAPKRQVRIRRLLPSAHQTAHSEDFLGSERRRQGAKRPSSACHVSGARMQTWKVDQLTGCHGIFWAGDADGCDCSS